MAPVSTSNWTPGCLTQPNPPRLTLHIICTQETNLVAALCVHINGGQEAGLGGVGMDPAHGVQPSRVLCLEDLLLGKGLHCIAGALLFRHYQGCDAEQPLFGVELASQDAAALYTAPCV